MHNESVLVISPHADDESFGCGGTILKHVSKGDHVTAVCMCVGDIAFEHTGGKVVSAHTRLVEFYKVCEEYKIRGEFAGFTNDSEMDTVPIKQIIKKIEEYIDEVRPDVIYIPGPSFHQDHRAVYDASITALRPTRKEKPRAVLVYELPTYNANPRQWQLNLNCYIDITVEVNRKIEICGMYKSQIRDIGNGLDLDSIKSHAATRGNEIGVSYAEAFEIVRILI